MEKLNINIAILGCESVGKTTFFNTLSGKLQPEIHCAQIINNENVSVNELFPLVESFNLDIKNTNNTNNTNNTKNIETDECFEIDQLDTNLYQDLSKLEIGIDLYDIPAPHNTSDNFYYYQWIQDNLKMFDVVIFMTDINNALKNKIENDFFQQVIRLIKINNNNLICLLNKCDEMYFDKNENDIILKNNHHENIFIEINNFLSEILLSNDIGYDLVTPFLPICSENSLIYRTLLNTRNKIYTSKLAAGHDDDQQLSNNNNNLQSSEVKYIFENNILECKEKLRDNGYTMIFETIKNILKFNKEKFIRNKLESDIKNLSITNRDDLKESINIISTCCKKIIAMHKSNIIVSYELFWNTIKIFCDKYIIKISNIDITDINKPYEKLDSVNFTKIYSIIDFYDQCTTELLSAIENMPEYPTNYFEIFCRTVSDKFFELFKIMENKKLGKDFNPVAFSMCLEIINRHSNNKFDYMAQVFLSKCIDEKYLYHQTHQNELAELIKTINKYSSSKDSEVYYSLICSLLINRCRFIENNQQFCNKYFYYLLGLKKIVKIQIKYFINKENSYKVTSYDILLEVINKNISLYISTYQVTNIWKQSLDLCKVKNELEKMTIDSTCDNIDFKFERSIFEFN